jgi:hypothetical protein
MTTIVEAGRALAEGRSDLGSFRDEIAEGQMPIELMLLAPLQEAGGRSKLAMNSSVNKSQSARGLLDSASSY